MRPLARHWAITPSGSVGLATLTQVGNAPQQLPTFLTVQSASLRQRVSTCTGRPSPAARGVGAAAGAAEQAPSTRPSSAPSSRPGNTDGRVFMADSGRVARPS